MLMLFAGQPTEIRVCTKTLVTDGVERLCLDAGPHLSVHLWEPIDEARERQAPTQIQKLAAELGALLAERWLFLELTDDFLGGW